MPVELILLGVIAFIFSIIFFFLYLELSTRKRQLVQDIKIILRDLPSKLSKRQRLKQSKSDSISELLKLEPQEESKLKDAEKVILEKYGNKEDEALPIINQAKILRNKIQGLDALSIWELERIQVTIRKYSYRELPKSDVDIESALSGANSMLDHFIALNSHKGNTGVKGGSSNL